MPKKLTPSQKRALTIAKRKRSEAAKRGWVSRRKNERKRKRTPAPKPPRKVKRPAPGVRKPKPKPVPRPKVKPKPKPIRRSTALQKPKPKLRQKPFIPPKKRRRVIPYQEIESFIQGRIEELVTEEDDSQDFYTSSGYRMGGSMKVVRMDLWIGNKKDTKGAGRVIRLAPVSRKDSKKLAEQILETLRKTVRKGDIYFYAILKGRNGKGQVGYRTLPKMLL